MEISAEKTELEKPQEILLGEEFSLFDPSHTKPRPEDPRLFERRFILITNTDEVPRLDFRAEIGFLEGGIGLEFVPFEPEKGYQVTKEDFKAETRRKKMENMLQNNMSNPLPEEFMFSLSGRGEILEEYRGAPDVCKNVLRKLNQLRLQFTANNMQLEGKKMPLPQDRNKSTSFRVFIYIARFYPADTGEFPSVWPNEKGQASGEEGQIVLLPNSIDKLSQIKAAFILRAENTFEARPQGLTHE